MIPKNDITGYIVTDGDGHVLSDGDEHEVRPTFEDALAFMHGITRDFGIEFPAFQVYGLVPCQRIEV